MAATSERSTSSGNGISTGDHHQPWLVDSVPEDNVIWSLREENRSLKIKIAGVDTLSSLLRGTRDELETIGAEKESLEVELSKLQCRCSMLEKDLENAKRAPQVMTGTSKSMFEALLKENKKLKNELKDAKTAGRQHESVLRPEALSELLMFKGELETEIKSLQKAMNSQEEESSISQISRLLGQVTKLEYQLKDKEEECKKLMTELSTCQTKSLDSQIQGKIGSQGAGDATEDGSKVDFQSQCIVQVVDAATQTVTEVEKKIREGPKEDKILEQNQTQGVVFRKSSSSVKRRNSKRASGDWTQLRKEHSELFDDQWNLDTINTAEQLQVTQDLLVQANEIILTMTEENDKLLKVNALLLQDIAHEENIQLDAKDKILDRFKFLFTDTNFEGNYDDIEAIQDILITGDLSVENINQSKDVPKMEEESSHPECQSNCLETSERMNKIITPSPIEVADLKDKNSLDTKRDSHAEDKDGMNINLQARDSGVDVYLSEAEKQLQLQPSDQSVEVGSQTSSDSVVLMAENCKLHSEIESQVKKLEEAEEKINELEEALRTMKKKEKQWREEIVEQQPSIPTQRLSKSIGHIPSSVRVTTYSRVVFESDV